MVNDRFYCEVKDIYGSIKTTNTVTLNVHIPLRIIEQPQSIVYTFGTLCELRVIAEGDELTYEWWHRSMGESWGKIGGNTDSLYGELNPEWYYCTITDKHGNAINTPEITITKISEINIANQPQDAYGTLGETVCLNLEANMWAAGVNSPSTVLTYQWYRENDGNAFLIHDAVDASMDLIISDENCGYRYYCMISDSYGNMRRSNLVQIIAISDHLAITEQPKDKWALIGETVVLSIQTVGDIVQYQWEREDNSQWVTVESGETSVLELILDADSRDRAYRCVVTDVTGEKLVSEIAHVKQQILLSIMNQPRNAYGKLNDDVLFAVEATGNDLTYTWMMQSDEEQFAISESNTPVILLKLTEEAMQYRYYCVISDRFDNTMISNKCGMFYAHELAVDTFEYVINDGEMTISWACSAADCFRLYEDGMLIAQTNGPERCVTVSGQGIGIHHYVIKSIVDEEESAISSPFDVFVDEINIEGIIYSLTEDTGCITVKKYIGTECSISIPSTISGYTVTTVAPYAFANVVNLNRIELPDSINILGEAAFSGCERLGRID